jgi:hypothetical protein
LWPVADIDRDRDHGGGACAARSHQVIALRGQCAEDHRTDEKAMTRDHPNNPNAPASVV